MNQQPPEVLPVNDRLIQAAMEYAGYGWRVLPLHTVIDGVCSCGKTDCVENSRGKHPRIKTWQHAATADESQIAQWWDKWPAANIGVTFGAGSGLVDIECDTPEEEAEYCALFSDDPPITATFQSGRGKHRLFRWRDDLPGGPTVKLGSIVVRIGNATKGAYSVFPPSVHHSGKSYRWLVPPSECPPADLPDAILARLWNLAGDPVGGGNGQMTLTERAKRYVAAIPGIAEGEGRNNRAYSIVRKFCGCKPDDFHLSESDAWSNLCEWNLRNTPPLKMSELRLVFLSATKGDNGAPGSKVVGIMHRKSSLPQRTKINGNGLLRGCNDAFAIVGFGGSSNTAVSMPVTKCSLLIGKIPRFACRSSQPPSCINASPSRAGSGRHSTSS